MSFAYEVSNQVIMMILGSREKEAFKLASSILPGI